MTIIGKKNVSDLSENIAMITIAASHIFSGVYCKSCSAVTLRNVVKYSTAHIAIITNGATANAAFAIWVILSRKSVFLSSVIFCHILSFHRRIVVSFYKDIIARALLIINIFLIQYCEKQMKLLAHSLLFRKGCDILL